LDLPEPKSSRKNNKNLVILENIKLFFEWKPPLDGFGPKN
jgi:hypothetical protein